MSELSPAAQAVWDAAWANTPVQCGDIEGTRRAQVAAALRAAADQMRYTDQLGLTGFGGYTQAQDQILAIADELEANG